MNIQDWFQTFGHLMQRTESLEKTHVGTDWRLEEKGTIEDELVGWHHWFGGRVWVSSRSWWWRGTPGVLQSIGSQRVGHDWVTELNWFPLRFTDLISLQPKGLSRVLSNTTVQKHQFFGAQFSLCYNSHIHTWLRKNHRLNRWTFVGKVMSLPFNMLSRFITAFLPRSKHLLI